MKVKFNGVSSENSSEYPCIKFSRKFGKIIWFTAPNTGFCLESKTDNKTGKHSNRWNENSYSPWYGTIEVTP